MSLWDAPGLDSQTERRINEAVDRRMAENLRGNELRTSVPPRSLPVNKLTPGSAGALLGTVGGVAEWTSAPSVAGQGMVWNGTMWVPTGVATQAELDAVAVRLEQSVQDLQDDFSGHQHDTRYGKILYAEEVGTSGFFALAFANIVSAPALSVVAGERYLLELTATASDGSSGATRQSDFRFTDGTNFFGLHAVNTLNAGVSAMALRARYTPATTGVLTFSAQAQCTSGTPAVRLLNMVLSITRM